MFERELYMHNSTLFHTPSSWKEYLLDNINNVSFPMYINLDYQVLSNKRPPYE